MNMKKRKGQVYFIGAGPGDPDLITVKGRKCIQNADLVLRCAPEPGVSHAAKTKKTTGLTQIVSRRGTLCDRLPVDHGRVLRIFMEKIAYFEQNCLPN